MSFNFKHHITHENKLVSDKVNFFADIFHFTHSNFGNPGFSELENHRSLLDKIKFQLDNYSSHSAKFIKHYFQNSYLSNKDLLIKNYYSGQWKKINALKLLVFEDFSSESTRSALNNEITLFINELNETLFQNSLDKIIIAILCEEGLKKHDHVLVFEYYTPLLACEFIFQGFPKEDLQKVFKKLLVKKANLTNDKVMTDAPLPQNILSMRDSLTFESDIFYNAVNEYLENRTLKQQFEGVYHLFKTSLKAKTYLFRVIDLEAYKPITLNYNGVVFSNELKSKYIKGNTRKAYKDFFEGNGRLFAEVTIKENNDKVGKSRAILKIKNALNFLNSTLSKNAKIEVSDYIIKDKDSNVRQATFTNVLHAEDVKTFIKYNPHELFKSKKNHLIESFLNLDGVYFQAKNDDREEAKLVHYWRYIESFFQAEGYDADKIKKIVSKILSKHYCFSFDHFNLAFSILYTAHQYDPNNSTGINQVLNIANIELNTLMQPKSFKKANYTRFIEVINHPYVTKKLKWYLESNKQVKEHIVNNFYIKIMTEAYEQRNFVEHSGIYEKNSVDKVLLTLPVIATDFRDLIIYELETHKYKSFKDLIEHLNNS